MAEQQASEGPKWFEVLPQPRSEPSGISDEETAELVKTKVIGQDYVVVDVRRTDFENYAIRGAVNLPAHSFYQTLPGIVPVFSRIPLVIFHCQSCGSVGSRGRRVAGWYQDALDSQGIKTSEARYLEGGIKGWITKYAQDETLSIKL